MKKGYLILAILNLFAGLSFSQLIQPGIQPPANEMILENFSYEENFENNLLGAWASYPHWQDIAYDQNFRIGRMIANDPNISLVQKVTPYSNVDNYAGAQKRMDAFLTPSSSITFRYFLKTHLAASFLKIRLAAGDYGKIDVTLPNPETNKWTWVTVSFEDFIRENPSIMKMDKIRIYALALLARVPDADLDMPFYLGVDDISCKLAAGMDFRFSVPEMYKLPEFTPYIPKSHYSRNQLFNLRGRWPLNADRVELSLASFTDTQKVVYKNKLILKNGIWEANPFKLDFPDGLYLARLTAIKGNTVIATTGFTIHIAPQKIAGIHPRLLFDKEKQEWIDGRLKKERFKQVDNDIAQKAKIQRENIKVSSLVYDLDQFPDENWLPSWEAWGSHLLNTSDALWWNALDYTFHKNREAGEYVKQILLTLSRWPDWTSPWQTKRGRHGEHRTGAWSHRLALAYDLTYDLMSPEERSGVRKAIFKNIIEGVHRTFVYDDNITGRTSNWIAMTVGGSLMSMASLFEDGEDVNNMEPYFTGAVMKYYSFINKVTGGKEGGWGEGLGYNEYSFANMSMNIPALKNVFNIDLSAPLENSYNEYIWSGIFKEKHFFHFGDAQRSLMPLSNWAFLLNMRKEPRLSWMYNYLKTGETFFDLIYETKNIPQDDPFDENPGKVFPKIGTTVFKSGWEKDDFSFSMRTGAFFNHQHLDQGSFMLSDRGVNFIEERDGSTYYDDPLYQSSFIQPVAHSTILINGNAQSQRIGDGYDFAPGFNDHAFIEQYLDGSLAAFSAGNIGRLYWNKVKDITRNVIYLKPRTLLMIDEVIPGNTDVDVSLLYQTSALKNITAGQHLSAITKEGATLNILHLAPASVVAKAVETPHYLLTLQKVKPLVKEGMLVLTARTRTAPLIFANLLTTTPGEMPPAVTTEKQEGYVRGQIENKNFAFTTSPGMAYQTDDIKTDALAVVWDEAHYFLAKTSLFMRGGQMVFESDNPVSVEISKNEIRYAAVKNTRIRLGGFNKPEKLIINNREVKKFSYEATKKIITVEIATGNGTIQVL